MSTPFIVQAANLDNGGSPSDVAFLGLNTPGNYLYAFCRATYSGVPSIADTAGNVWVQIFADASGRGCWYSIHNSFQDPNTVTFTWGGGATNERAYVVEVGGGAQSITTGAGSGTGTLAATQAGSFPISVPINSGNWAIGMAVFSGSPGAASLGIAGIAADAGFVSGVQIAGGWGFSPFSPAPDAAFSEVIGSLTLLPQSSSDILTDLCVKAGLDPAQIDTSLMTPTNLQFTNVVPGYLIERPTPTASIIKVLMQAYFFDAVESAGKIKFIPRGLAPVVTIPEADLGLISDGGALTETILQAQDLPQEFSVLYNDPALDYQQGKQLKGRNVRVIRTKQKVVLEIPIAMTADMARQIAEKALYLAWLERYLYQTNLWRSVYMALDPTDVVNLLFKGLTFEVRIIDNNLGQGFVTEINGVSEDARNYLSFAAGGGDFGFNPGGVQAAQPSLLFLFDIPLLRDTDSNPSGTGFYFAMSSIAASWPGGVLFESADNASFTAGPGDSNAVSFGFTLNALADPRSPWTWDRANSLTVQMSRGALTGDTMLNVLNGANAILVGQELIQFLNAIQNSDGSYTLSGLLRGRRGTEWAIGTHAIGETVTVPSTGFVRVPDALSLRNLTLFYRGVTVGQDPGVVNSQTFTIIGRDLMPYSPVHVKATRDGGNNLSLTWVRRTRIGGGSLSKDPVPLSEQSEAYEVDIFNGSTLVRSITGLSSPAASYSAADQTTDFGSPQSSIAMKVYQLSAQVGKGFPANATV